MNIHDKASSLASEIISSYKLNNMLVTSIELRVFPKMTPELIIQYFDMDKKEIMLNVSILDIEL